MWKVKLIVIAALAITLLPTGLYAASPQSSGNGNDIGIYSIFDPSFKYLDSGSSSLTSPSAGKVKLSGKTAALQPVDTIGIKLTLQRWTGTEWKDYDAGTNMTLTDDSLIVRERQLTVPGGYYYRVRSTHWIVQDGVKEQGEIISSSLLVN